MGGFCIYFIFYMKYEILDQNFRLRAWLPPAATTASCLLYSGASSNSHFETQIPNYFGYLNQISAIPSCEPIKKPFGISGNGFEAITARSAA